MLCSYYVEGMLMLRWRYVHVTLKLCSYYVEVMFMLRWSYVHITLKLCWCYVDAMFILRWRYVDVTLKVCSCYVEAMFILRWSYVHVTLKLHWYHRCWKSCKRMIPNSLTSRHPMIKTYCKAWQWRFVNRSHQMSARTAKKLRKLGWRNGPKTCTFSHRKHKTRSKIGSIFQSLKHVKYCFRLNETTLWNSS